MSDMFESVANKYKNSPSSLVLFLASLAMLIIGINHFGEDTYSSYMGLISIEQHFNLNVQAWNWTYWTMSITPQIAGIVFFYVFLADTSKGWAWWVAFFTQTIDFLSDLWFRSNGSAFTNWGATGVSALITLAFFTIGSEFFITIGAGLVLKLAAPALRVWKYYTNEFRKVKRTQDGGGFSGQNSSQTFNNSDRHHHDRGQGKHHHQVTPTTKRPIRDDYRGRLPSSESLAVLYGVKGRNNGNSEENEE